jgi:hypothetical protein
MEMEFLKIFVVILLYVTVLGFGILCARLMDRRKQLRTLALEGHRGESAGSTKEDFHG